MKIAFHGAARTVTGSKHLLTLSNGRKYLLDCGMFQGLGQATNGLNRNWGFDSAEIQEDDVKYANKKRAAEKQPYLKPLYTVADAEQAFDYLRPLDYDQWHAIDEFVEVMYTDAGHIIGSAVVNLRI